MTDIEYKIREILNNSNKMIYVFGGDNEELEELDVDLATSKLLELFEELSETGAFDENDE